MNRDVNSTDRAPDQAPRLWADMRQRHALGQPVRVEDYLADPAFPVQDHDLILDLVYGEFALREQAGEEPTVAEYVARFPHLGDRITRQVELHLALSLASRDLNNPQDETSASGSQVTLARDLPRQIGKYRVISRLGAGGQATVYRAVHPGLQQDVVIKISHHRVAANSPDGEALATEGRILAGLRHPNLARVYDLDQDDGHPFVVMEYIPGRSLEQVARHERPPPGEAARMVAAVARAVAHAHARGVVHLDIKPGNVLLGEGMPRLIDFGLGRLRPAWTDRPDDTTEVSGTLSYMAPERATGAAGQSLERADLFGLGGVLYFLLTGQAPFRAQSATNIWDQVQAGEWDQTLLERPEIPRPLRQICRRCLATNPAARYGSADVLAADLERFAHGPRFSRRVLLAGGAAVVLLVALGLAIQFLPTAAPQKPTATERPLPPDPKLQLRVWNGERYQDLIRCLPLQSGDEVRIETERPTGFYVVLLWADPEGVVRELATARPEQEGTKMVYPEVGQAVPLEGRPGTELILLCARRDRPLDVAGLRKKLSQVQEWPALPGSSVVRLSREGVKVENTGRGPGQSRQRNDPEGEVVNHLRKLQTELRQECEVLVGVAVAHQ